MLPETMYTYLLLRDLDLTDVKYDTSILDDTGFRFEPFPSSLLENKFLPETVLRDKKYYPYTLIKTSKPYSGFNDSDTQGMLGEINCFLLACWLFDQSNIRFSGYMRFSQAKDLSSSKGVSYRGFGYHVLRSGLQSTKNFQKVDFNQLLQAWKLLLEIFLEESVKYHEAKRENFTRAPLQIALFFTLKGLLAKEFSLRQLLFWASLEALYATERKYISNTCAKRISNIFGNDANEREELLKKCRESYNLRSTYIHGNLNGYKQKSPGFTKNSNDAFLENILKETIYFILSNKDVLKIFLSGSKKDRRTFFKKFEVFQG